MTRMTFANITFNGLIILWVGGLLLDLAGLLTAPPERYIFPGALTIIYGAQLLYFREEDAEIAGRTWWIRGFGKADKITSDAMGIMGALFVAFGVFNIVKNIMGF